MLKRLRFPICMYYLLISLVRSRMFRRMDDDDSKQLNFAEFHKGVNDSGCELTQYVVENCCCCCCC